MAYTTLRKLSPQIIDAYDLLSNGQEDQGSFIFRLSYRQPKVIF